MILGHWDVRGAGQPIRNLLHYLSLPYTEVLYPDEASWFTEAKSQLKSDFPNLPYLIDGDKTITESQAILVYLSLKAKRIDLLGKTLEGEIHFVQIRSYFADIRNKFYEIAMNKAENLDFHKEIKEKLEFQLKALSKHLGEQDFICGGLTVMDFVIVELIEWIKLQDNDLLLGLENLVGLMKRVYELPGVSEYMKKGNIPKYFLWPSYANKKLRICY